MSAETTAAQAAEIPAQPFAAPPAAAHGEAETERLRTSSTVSMESAEQSIVGNVPATEPAVSASRELVLMLLTSEHYTQPNRKLRCTATDIDDLLDQIFEVVSPHCALLRSNLGISLSSRGPGESPELVSSLAELPSKAKISVWPTCDAAPAVLLFP